MEHETVQTGKSSRRPRRDKGITIIMSRDRRVLPWIGEQYAVRLDQVQVLLGRDGNPGLSSSAISLSAALQVVRRWTELGLVEYRRMVHGEPGWVWLTHHGLGELGLTYTKYAPKLSALPHLYLVNRLRLVHEQRNPLYPWKSERALRAELPRRAAGVNVAHLPDGVILDPNGSIALEVELTVKSQERLTAILHSLLEEPAEDDRPKYARIWYFAAAAARPHVERALLDLEEDQRERVRVYALETLQSK